MTSLYFMIMQLDDSDSRELNGAQSNTMPSEVPTPEQQTGDGRPSVPPAETPHMPDKESADANTVHVPSERA